MALPWLKPGGGLPWLSGGGGLPWLSSRASYSPPGGGFSGAPSLTPEEMFAYQKQLAAARLTKPPSGGSGGGFLGSLGRVADLATPDLVGLAMRQIGESLLYTPAGFAHMGAQLGSDIAGFGRGDFDMSGVAGIGAGMLQQTAEDIRHPLRNPGYLAMDVANLLSMGAVGATKVSGAARAVRSAYPKPSPIIDPGSPLPGPGGVGATPRPPAPTAGPSILERETAEVMREQTKATNAQVTADAFLREVQNPGKAPLALPSGERLALPPGPPVRQAPAWTQTADLPRVADIQARTRAAEVAQSLRLPLSLRKPIDATIQRKLDFLEQRGYRASVEDGQVRLHAPEEGKGGPLKDIVDSAYATEDFYKGLASGTEAKLRSDISKEVQEREVADMAGWQRTRPGEPFPATNPAITTPTLERFTSATRRDQLRENRTRATDRPSPSPVSGVGERSSVPYPIADETTGKPIVKTEAQIKGAEKRKEERLRKLAKDAGFTNYKAAATAISRANVEVADWKTVQAVKKAQDEAFALAGDKARVTSRNPTAWGQIPYMEVEWGAKGPMRYARGDRVQKRGGEVYVDGKPSGVVWRPSPTNPGRWEVVAHDRNPYFNRTEYREALEGWMAEQGSRQKGLTVAAMESAVAKRYPGGIDKFIADHKLKRNAEFTTPREAYLAARVDAVEKVVQGRQPGERYLDQPTTPELTIDGKPVTVHQAVEIGLEKNRLAKQEERAAKAAADAEAQKAAAAEAAAALDRRRKAIAALGRDPDVEAPLPKEAVDILKEEAPPEMHDLLDELAAASDEVEPLFKEAEGPSEAELRKVREEQLIADDELAQLSDIERLDDDMPEPHDLPEEGPTAPAPKSTVEHQGDFAPAATLVGDSGTGTFYWRGKDERVWQTKDPDPTFDESGKPSGAMSEVSKGLWDKYASDPESFLGQAVARVGGRSPVAVEAAPVKLAPTEPRAGQRGSGSGRRELKANKAAMVKVGVPEEIAQAKADVLYKALKEAGITESSRASEFVAVYRKAFNMTEDAAKELYGRLHTGPDKAPALRPKPPVGKSGGSLLETMLSAFQNSEALQRIYKGKLTKEQVEELHSRAKGPITEMMATFREAREAGNPVPAREQYARLEKVLEEVTDAPTAKALAENLWEIKGGSGDSRLSIFTQALFEPQPRQHYVLRRPDVEKIPNPRYAAWKKWSANKEAIPTQKEFQKTIDRPVEKLTRANLSLNPVRRGFQRFLYEYGVNRAPEWRKDASRLDRMRARYADSKFEFEFNERARIQDMIYPSEAGKINPDGKKKMPGIGDWIDSANQLATLLTLYMKPGYVPPNYIGQILFTTIDSAWNPIALARSYDFHRQIRQGALGPEHVRALHEAIGTGMYESIRPERGAIKGLATVNENIARGYSKFMDVPHREAVFFNEAWRAGFRDIDSIKRLLDSKPGDAMFEDLISIAQNANRNIVDYSRLSTAEKRVIRRIVFFYPWIKGSTIYTGRFVSEHPFQATAALQSARIGQERAEEILGEVPSYLKGLIPGFGSTDVRGMGELPNVMNPQALSIFGSAGQAVNAARGFAFGDVRAGEQLSEYFTPAISASIAAATRVDPFTGARYEQGVSPLEIFAKEISQTIAPLRAVEKVRQGMAIQSGKKDPSNMLFPSTPSQEAMSFFVGGMYPRTYNMAEGQERAAAETLGIESKQKQSEIKWNDRIRIAAQEAKKVGLTMDKSVADAFKQKAARAAEYDALARSLGKKERELRQVEKLQADMGILVRKGIYTEEQAKTLILQYAGMPDSAITSLRTKLHRAYMGQALLTDFKARMGAAGANLENVETDL